MNEERVKEIVREEVCRCGYCRYCIRRCLNAILNAYDEHLLDNEVPS